MHVGLGATWTSSFRLLAQDTHLFLQGRDSMCIQPGDLALPWAWRATSAFDEDQRHRSI